MTDEQLSQARAGGGEVLHVPLALGGIVPAYNLEGLGKHQVHTLARCHDSRRVRVVQPAHLIGEDAGGIDDTPGVESVFTAVFQVADRYSRHQAAGF